MTRPKRFDQILAGFADGDAISQEARKIRDCIRALGMESDIYAPAGRVSLAVRDQCRRFDEYRGAEGDVLLYHYSIASEASAVFAASRARRILRYHNITPSGFFRGFDEAVARQLDEARGGLSAAAGQAESIWAVSEYNAQELRALGLPRVRVMPLFYSPDDFARTVDPRIMAKFSADLTNLFFVGRMAPNKCVEDLILAFAWYHTCINPRSRLILVGSEYSCPRYFALLRLLAGRLELPNVCFEGFVSPEGLAAYYKLAHAFVCTSRHEGYCLPLVEAMAHGVPVIARRQGGMPEAMGSGGVLFDHAEPRVLAELIGRVIGDAALRQDVLASQQRRMEEIRRRDLAADCLRLLAE